MEYSDSDNAANLRSDFLQLLRCRRTAEVPLSVEPAKPVQDPLYQENPKPTFTEAMESCPKKEIPNFKELLQEEILYLTTEDLISGLPDDILVSIIILIATKEAVRTSSLSEIGDFN